MDSDRILRGLLAYGNTPDYDTGKSPAMVLFGRPLRGFLPVAMDKLSPCDNWRRLCVDIEQALAKRAVLSGESLGTPTRQIGFWGIQSDFKISSAHTQKGGIEQEKLWKLALLTNTL